MMFCLATIKDHSEKGISSVHTRKMKFLAHTALVTGFFFLSNAGIAVADCAAPVSPAGGLNYVDATTGFQYCDGTTWQDFGSGSGAAALNDLSDSFTDYTTDHNMTIGHEGASITATQGQNNLVVGRLTGDSITTGDNNTALGYETMTALTTGNSSTAVGYHSLNSVVSVHENTAVGYESMERAYAGGNTALGVRALRGGTTATNNTGTYNVAIGDSALENFTTGSGNIAIGQTAMASATTAVGNIAIGQAALLLSSTSTDNIAFGTSAGYDNTVGSANIAIGTLALSSNVSANQNIAIGPFAMRYANSDAGYAGWQSTSNTAIGYEALRGSGTPADNTGTENTAIGHSSMVNNTSGDTNTAVGVNTLNANTTGWGNVALGQDALASNTTGTAQVAIGGRALRGATGAGGNDATVAVGYEALLGADVYFDVAMGYRALGYKSSTDGNVVIGANAMRGSTTPAGSVSNNVAIGNSVMVNNDDGDNNVAIGRLALGASTGSNNIALGYQAGDNITSGENNIMIGHDIDAASPTANSQLNIGDTIYGDLATDRVAIGTSSQTASIQLKVAGTGGIMIPAGTDAQRPATGAAGMVRYNSTSTPNDKIEYYDAESAGWVQLASGSGGGAATINDLTDAATDYTTDHNMWIGSGAGAAIASGGADNILIGENAGNSITTGDENVGIGYLALSSVTTGGNNTALGNFALQSITGVDNTAIGRQAMGQSTNSQYNVAVGSNAMAYGNAGQANTVVGANSGTQAPGSWNTVLGANALNAGAGNGNVAVGAGSLAATTGDSNTAIGSDSMTTNTTGIDNVALGSETLKSSVDGNYSVAIGARALYSMDGGGNNIAIGIASMQLASSSYFNTAIGSNALNNVSANYNIGVGASAGASITTGQNNITIGHDAGATTLVTGSDNILIGNSTDTGTAGTNNQLNIGNVITGDMGTGNLAIIGTSALRVPNGTTAQRPTGAGGMIRYNTTATPNDKIEYYDAESAGWLQLASGAGGGAAAIDDLSDAVYDITTDHNLIIGSNTAPTTGAASNVWIGDQVGHSTTNAADANVVIGQYSLIGNTTGADNIVLGFQAMVGNTSGNSNIALGTNALYTNSTGTNNAAIGKSVLSQNQDGNNNIAILGMAGSTTGDHNIGLGVNVLNQNQGDNNIALGQNALYANSTGISNIAIGVNALNANTTADHNVGIGDGALSLNQTGDSNVAIGYTASYNNTNASDNVAIGNQALTTNSTGANNVAIGIHTLQYSTENQNTGVGDGAFYNLATGSRNVSLGSLAGNNLTDGTNNIAIGYSTNFASATADDQLNIGNVITGDMATGNLAVVGTAALRVPNGTTAQRPTGAGGMIRYNTTATPNDKIEYYDAESAGWLQLASGAGGGAAAIDDLSDAAVDYTAPGTMYLGQNVGTLNTGYYTTAIGIGALQAASTGPWTTAVGYHALGSNTTGAENTAIGSETLPNNTTGSNNNAVGAGGLYSNTTGDRNITFGTDSLYNNLDGNDNIAIGHNALRDNVSGYGNIAIGTQMLVVNTGNYNVTVGGMYSNTTGLSNVSVGNSALYANTTGSNNAALGSSALATNTTATRNTAMGDGALASSNTDDNAAFGYRALFNATGSSNTALGSLSGSNITTGSSNIIIGQGIDAPSATTDSQLNIGDTIYGDLATDRVAIGTATQTTGIQLKVAGTGGIMIPAGTNAQRPATGAAGMVRYNSDATPNDKIEYYDAESAGWVQLAGGAGGGAAAINDLSDGYADYVTDYNLALGNSAGTALTTGGQYNTLLGIQAGDSVTTGDNNTAIGVEAGQALTTGNDNVALGFVALTYAESDGNTAIGSNAMRYFNSSTGGENTAIGFESGPGAAGDAGANTVVGARTLTQTTDGSYNSVFGRYGMNTNTTGSYNTAIGQASLFANTTGEYNTALGSTTGATLETGDYNILIGNNADVPTASTSNWLNIGDTIYGDLATDRVAIGTATQTASIQLKVAGTGGIMIPAGTDAQRPATGAAGMVRYNSTATPNDKIEYYDAESAAWVQLSDGAGGGSSLWTDNTTHISRSNFHVLNTGLVAGSTTAGLDGNGTYSFFDPDKGAMRGGTISGGDDAWQDGNIGDNSFAWGTNAKALGATSIAMGQAPIATANGAVALGIIPQATGYSAVSIGYNNIASGTNTVSLGTEVNSTGSGAFGFGTYLDSTGTNSMALGFKNSVSGNYSVSLGIGNSVSWPPPTVSANNSFGIFMGDQSGVDLAQANTMSLMGGKLGIGTVTPSVELEVTGDIEYTGTITDVSDMRLKDNIEPLIKTGSLLDRIDHINTYSFSMKDDKTHSKEFGVMAQELEKVFPELVKTAKDEMRTKSVNYVGLIAPMIEATKELRAENKEMKTALDNLSKQVEVLNDIAGNKVGKASSENFWMLLLGLLGGIGSMLAIQRKKNNG